MNYLLIILATITIAPSLTAADNQKTQNIPTPTKNQQLDSMKRHVLAVEGTITVPEKEPVFDFWTMAFPSIAALVVGGLALGGTIYAGKLQRESSEKALQAQIAAAKDALTQQIVSAKENADKQIASADAAVKLNFRKEVLSVNRQNWINDLRDVISTITAFIDFHSQYNDMPADDHKKISQLFMKAELMVNPKKDKEFVAALNNLNRAFNAKLNQEDTDLDSAVFKLIELTKVILKTEWERVKKGE